MLFADVAYLISEELELNEIGDSVGDEIRRPVFVDVQSIGLKRKMEALTAGLKIDFKFVLADKAEYQNEEIIEYNGSRYNIISTYINDAHQIELTTARY